MCIQSPRDLVKMQILTLQIRFGTEILYFWKTPGDADVAVFVDPVLSNREGTR